MWDLRIECIYIRPFWGNATAVCLFLLLFTSLLTMAQLPPKVPYNWTDFPNQKMDGLGFINPTHNQPFWTDEFLSFSSSRRCSHRRSMTDSVAFMEVPMEEECRRNESNGDKYDNGSKHLVVDSNGGGGDGDDFGRFDDEQLMYIFADDNDVAAVGPTLSCSNPSSPSDHNSINVEEKQGVGSPVVQLQVKREPEEVESSCKSEGIFASHAANREKENSSERIADPKRIKRILANRQSAQRSRVRKLQYISELERSVSSLQAEVSVLSPRVAFLDHQRLVLNADNCVLKQRIAALVHDKVFKDAHQETLRSEIERLRQVYCQQKMTTEITTAPTAGCSIVEKGQLAVN